MRISDWSSDLCSSDLLRSFAQELTAIACDEAPFGSIRHVAAKPEGKEFDQRVNGIALFQQLIVAFIAVERDRSEEHTSELQSLMRISYAVFCLKKKKSKHKHIKRLIRITTQDVNRCH